VSPHKKFRVTAEIRKLQGEAAALIFRPGSSLCLGFRDVAHLFLLMRGANGSCDLFIYFILRHGARGLWPKDEKKIKKGETVIAAKETRKHTSK
jgi:hypothetical protein